MFFARFVRNYQVLAMIKIVNNRTHANYLGTFFNSKQIIFNFILSIVLIFNFSISLISYFLAQIY